jgi:hypothetical protein
MSRFLLPVCHVDRLVVGRVRVRPVEEKKEDEGERGRREAKVGRAAHVAATPAPLGQAAEAAAASVLVLLVLHATNNVLLVSRPLPVAAAHVDDASGIAVAEAKVGQVLHARVQNGLDGAD